MAITNPRKLLLKTKSRKMVTTNTIVIKMGVEVALVGEGAMVVALMVVVEMVEDVVEDGVNGQCP